MNCAITKSRKCEFFLSVRSVSSVQSVFWLCFCLRPSSPFGTLFREANLDKPAEGCVSIIWDCRTWLWRLPRNVQSLQGATVASAAGQFFTVPERDDEFAAVAGLQRANSRDIYDEGAMNADELEIVELRCHLADRQTY